MRRFKLKNSEKSEITSAIGMISQVGFTMIVTIIITLLFGDWLDNKFGTSPLFLVISILLGVGSAFRNMFVMTMKMTKKPETKQEKEEQPHV